MHHTILAVAAGLDSYAAHKGDARNVGVIGVAFFAERGVRRDLFDREAERRRAPMHFPAPSPTRRDCSRRRRRYSAVSASV